MNTVTVNKERMPATTTTGMQLSNKLTINDIDFKGKRVLVRVDYNVPLNKDGSISNNQRIVASLPTIKLILEKGAKAVILMSHLGRPDGQKVSSMSLSPVANELSNLLGGRPLRFLTDCVGSYVEKACGEEKDGEIILLENLRFHIEEEGSCKRTDGTKLTATAADIEAFRNSLTSLADVYVNDAFGAIHRAHSSIVGIKLPRVAGLLIQKELSYFSRILESPEKIDLAILGGSKVSDKIQLIKNLLPRVRRLSIDGGMAFTFLKVLKGMEIGKSLFDEVGAATVTSIMEEAEKQGVEIILPVDFITGNSLNENAVSGEATVSSGIPSDMMGLDIGIESTRKLVDVILDSKSILWNGPVGVFEVSHFSHGTRSVVEALVEATAKGAITIVGGGDSGAAVSKWHADEKLSHVSTGGGASLELLEGKELPGIVALTDSASCL